MPQLTALVRASARNDMDRRSSERHAGNIEAITKPLDAADAITWGAQVRDVSRQGLGLVLCYPFRAGAYLAVDLKEPAGGIRTLLTRVVHAQDQADGTWHVGCEFVKPLSDDDLETIVEI